MFRPCRPNKYINKFKGHTSKERGRRGEEKEGRRDGKGREEKGSEGKKGKD